VLPRPPGWIFGRAVEGGKGGEREERENEGKEREGSREGKAKGGLLCSYDFSSEEILLSWIDSKRFDRSVIDFGWSRV